MLPEGSQNRVLLLEYSNITARIDIIKKGGEKKSYFNEKRKDNFFKAKKQFCLVIFKSHEQLFTLETRHIISINSSIYELTIGPFFRACSLVNLQACFTAKASMPSTCHKLSYYQNYINYNNKCPR